MQVVLGVRIGMEMTRPTVTDEAEEKTRQELNRSWQRLSPSHVQHRAFRQVVLQ